MKKTIAGFAVFVAFISFAPSASAALTQTQISAILGLLSSFGADASIIANVQASLSGGTPSSTTASSNTSSCTFSTDLTIGAVGNNVMCLQKQLIAMGYPLPAGATGTFGPQTRDAVIAWQKAHGVQGTGYFGPMSRQAFMGNESIIQASTQTDESIRAKANDAAIKANLATIMTQSAIYYDDHGNTYGTTNSGVGATCSKTGTLFTDQYITAAIAKADADNEAGDIVCTSTATAYMVATQLSNGTYWCVDSMGIKTALANKPTTESVSCKSTPPATSMAPTTTPSSSGQFIFQNIIGIGQGKEMNVFAPNQKISFSVIGKDSNGSFATPDTGANMQVYIYDSARTKTYAGINASFDYSTNSWKAELTAPSDTSVKLYDLEIILYCSHLGTGICASSYTGNAQNVVTLNFGLSGSGAISTQPTISYVQAYAEEVNVIHPEEKTRVFGSGLPVNSAVTVYIGKYSAPGQVNADGSQVSFTVPKLSTGAYSVYVGGTAFQTNSLMVTIPEVAVQPSTTSICTLSASPWYGDSATLTFTTGNVVSGSLVTFGLNNSESSSPLSSVYLNNTSQRGIAPTDSTRYRLDVYNGQQYGTTGASCQATEFVPTRLNQDQLNAVTQLITNYGGSSALAANIRNLLTKGGVSDGSLGLLTVEQANNIRAFLSSFGVSPGTVLYIGYELLNGRG